MAVKMAKSVELCPRQRSLHKQRSWSVYCYFRHATRGYWVSSPITF